MFEFSVLILTALTLFIVSLSVLFYFIITNSKKLDMLRQVLYGRTKVSHHHGCSHRLGYLISHPRNSPIPNECMGCSDIFECLELEKSKPTQLEEVCKHEVQGVAYLKAKLVLGLVTLLVGILAANLALFQMVEQIYARYICAFGGFAAIIFGAMLFNDFLVLRKVSRGEYAELMLQYATEHETVSVSKKKEKKKVVDKGRKKRKQTIAASSLAIYLLLSMLCPILVSSLLSYNATVTITPKAASETLWLYVDSYDGTWTEWIEFGTTPYLNAVDYDTNYITTMSNNTEAGSFGFSNSGKSTETITNVVVEVYVNNTRTGDSLELLVWNGSQWTSLGIKEAPTFWSWINWNATTQLDSWAKVDGAEICLRWQPQTGSHTVTADCARLQVGYS